MGRRKIEIQPITHERNRSVTFLKRKNGLFKKAYELGVLCSVDVAVIIFEERPGHHAKLYQYCSTDVNGMVQRHLRFDGERDTKGPSDFNNTSKADEAADDDDDADEDDSSTKRRDSTKSVKVKAENSTNSIVPIRPGPTSSPNDASTSPDHDYRPNMRMSPTASTSSSSLPISGERHTSSLTSATRSVPISSTAKRPRLGLDDPSHLAQSSTMNHNSNHVGGSGSPTFPFRIDVDLPSSYSSVIPSLSQMHSPHPSLNALYPGGSMPGMISAPPSSFLSNTPFDISRPPQQQQPPLRAVTYPHSTSSHYSPTGHQNPPSIFSRATSGQGGGGGPGGIFADLLGSAGEHGNGAGGHGSQFPAFDWPVHAGTSQHGSQGQHENGAPQGSTSSSAASTGGPDWFDFLSSGPGPGGLSLPPPVPPLNMSRFAMSPSGMGRKRLRDESVASDSGESDIREIQRAASVNGSGSERKS
ncbi:hypothetical protein L226DRAFT_559395 [Lentinus tigrinus ALCF2SS1-7]|uniref:MADS-box domain-containing protein n=1 Tax=Lentinus tigrinus ALCF2SS1-6 TaxID=1328759 RepID=A0A5C2SK74_9APHY|nr:hypothetical protein L227DRAFT_650285 [Lentinus tigrinus ALCF2SS1-6]RPD76253.1 hypothetical protein L226DRAFT_559395 [Lentinus tigrinus ALCF2SS1-7]